MVKDFLVFLQKMIDWISQSRQLSGYKTFLTQIFNGDLVFQYLLLHWHNIRGLNVNSSGFGGKSKSVWGSFIKVTSQPPSNDPPILHCTVPVSQFTEKSNCKVVTLLILAWHSILLLSQIYQFLIRIVDQIYLKLLLILRILLYQDEAKNISQSLKDFVLGHADVPIPQNVIQFWFFREPQKIIDCEALSLDDLEYVEVKWAFIWQSRVDSRQAK